MNNARASVLLAAVVAAAAAAAFFIGLMIGAPYARAVHTERESITTPYGPLSISCDTQIQFGECRLRFGNDVIKHESLRLAFDDSVRKTAPYYLVQVLSGGVRCPAMMFIVDLSSPTEPSLTPAFGTCSDRPAVSVGNRGEIMIDIPTWDKPGFERWSYRSGTLQRLH